LVPLTVRLVPVLAQIGRLLVRFRRAELNPQAGHQFETPLQELRRGLGRIIVEWTFKHLEPRHKTDMPKQMGFQGTLGCHRGKTPNRSVATVFGTITLWRWRYQPLHGVESSIVPLELRFGLEVGLATPALAERVAQAAIAFPQRTVLTHVKETHGVSGSVTS